MPSIGPVEIVVVAAIALIVFGPERLPDIARNIGKAIQELRRMASDVRGEFDLTIEEETSPERISEPESPPAPEEENPEAPPLARMKDESPDEEDRT